MHNSILMDVRKGCNIPEWDDGFDQELIMFINTAIFDLAQIGVGPPNGFSIIGKEETWSSIIEGSKQLEAVKTFVTLKVKLVFDPPTSSFVLESMKNIIAECEWRLNVQAEGAFDNESDGLPE